MSEIPPQSNFYASLHTSLSKSQVADLFASAGWHARECSWTDFEAISPFAELVIEAEGPILLHGPVADVEENADRILSLLGDAGIGYTAESYDSEDGLLRKFRRGID